MNCTEQTIRIVPPSEARSVRGISAKNGEIVREILLRINSLVKITTGDDETETQEPCANCILDELEIQNQMLGNALVKLSDLEVALGNDVWSQVVKP